VLDQYTYCTLVSVASYVYSGSSQFIFFVKTHFTTDTLNIVLLNQYTHEHVMSWTVTPFEGPGKYYKDFTGIKNAF